MGQNKPNFRRRIKSVSGLITNSSTQVFNLPSTKDFLQFINKMGIKDEIIIIYDKEDLIKKLEDYYSEEYGDSDIFELFYNFLDEDTKGILGDSYGSSQFIDSLVKVFKKTPREVIDFLGEDHFKAIYNKPFYSYQDDCGYPKVAKILHEAGYPSGRRNY